jgi:hypothetical protein
MKRSTASGMCVAPALCTVAVVFLATQLMAQVASLDPAKMPIIGTVDERFQSYNIEMVEVIGGRFWKPEGSTTEMGASRTKGKYLLFRSTVSKSRCDSPNRAYALIELAQTYESRPSLARINDSLKFDPRGLRSGAAVRRYLASDQQTRSGQYRVV